MTVKEILRNIVEWREQKRKYSQSYLAQRLGITQKAYSKIETGETKLSVQYILDIADILDIEVNDLFELETNNHDNEQYFQSSEAIKNEKLLYEKLLASKERELEILHKYITRLEKDL